MVAKNHHKLDDVVSHRITATISWFHERFPCELSSEERAQNSILMTWHYSVLVSASDWLEIYFKQSQALSRSGYWQVIGVEFLSSFFRLHFAGKPFCGVAKFRLFLVHLNQTTFRDATNGFPAKWRLRSERRNSILMTRQCQDLANASDWSCRLWNLLQPIRGTT